MQLTINCDAFSYHWDGIVIYHQFIVNNTIVIIGNGMTREL